MNTSEIDQRRRYYRDVLRQWADSLYELDEHPTYRLLAAGDLSGTTGAETNETMSTAPQLWALMGQVRSILNDVDELTEQRSVFNNTDVAAAEALKPIDGLVEQFRHIYEPVRDVVARVDAVWRDLMPRIDAATTTLARAEALSERLDMSVPEVRLARQRLDAVRASVADDPLSLSGKVGPDLDRLVANAATAAGTLERAHGNLDADLSGTDALLANLRVLRARAAAAFSEAEAKIIPANALIRIPGTSVIDGPNGLAHRAAQIVGEAETGTHDWQRAREEIDRWRHAAERLRSQLERGLTANRAPIEQRDELRGLLRAYRAKASMSTALPDSVSELGQRAHDELYTSPSDIERAKELIDKFASQLSTYSGGS